MRSVIRTPGVANPPLDRPTEVFDVPRVHGEASNLQLQIGGLVQLLRRRCRWILSFDVGDDPECEFLDLRAAIALSRQERLCSFYLHKDPRRDLEDVLEAFRKSKEPFLHLGVLYSDETGQRDSWNGFRDRSYEDQVGEIFHVRMRLLDHAIPVQPLVQREEVLLSERGIFSVNRVIPATVQGSVVELHAMPEEKRC
eukprot:g564.t1